jgi:hypothetical protein
MRNARSYVARRPACDSRPRRDVLRAKLALYAADGLGNDESAGGFQMMPEDLGARPGLLESAGRVLDRYKGTPGRASGFSGAT